MQHKITKQSYKYFLVWLQMLTSLPDILLFLQGVPGNADATSRRGKSVSLPHTSSQRSEI